MAVTPALGGCRQDDQEFAEANKIQVREGHIRLSQKRKQKIDKTFKKLPFY